MINTAITAAARTATLAVLAGAAALSLAGTAHAAPSAPGQAGPVGGLYGDPAAAAPYWRHQTLDDCALMATADVIGQSKGHEPSERAIIRLAQKTPSTSHSGSIYIKPANPKDPNSGMGTDPADIPALLAHYGIPAALTDQDNAAKTSIPTGMAALEQDLAGGHKVIAGVNAELIWGKPVQITTQDGQPAADHAVVVTGVDTAAGVVHLNDSGTPNGRDEQVPLGIFAKSWATSRDFMVVTTETN